MLIQNTDNIVLLGGGDTNVANTLVGKSYGSQKVENEAHKNSGISYLGKFLSIQCLGHIEIPLPR